MSRNWLVVLILCGSLAAAAELSEKFSKRIDSAEAAYQQAVAKADNVRFYAVQKANSDRVKALKQVLTDATKTGDFDAATEIKERITDAEQTGPRAKPKDVVRFGGHEYAVIPERVTWHVAKRLCEEMGGHLAVIDNADEQAFAQSLLSQSGGWVGASDEVSEGDWKWVTGKTVAPAIKATWALNNLDDAEHSLAYWPPDRKWMDGFSSHRYPFLCEWE